MTWYDMNYFEYYFFRNFEEITSQILQWYSDKIFLNLNFAPVADNHMWRFCGNWYAIKGIFLLITFLFSYIFSYLMYFIEFIAIYFWSPSIFFLLFSTSSKIFFFTSFWWTVRYPAVICFADPIYNFSYNFVNSNCSTKFRSQCPDKFNLIQYDVIWYDIILYNII